MPPLTLNTQNDRPGPFRWLSGDITSSSAFVRPMKDAYAASEEYMISLRACAHKLCARSVCASVACAKSYRGFSTFPGSPVALSGALSAEESTDPIIQTIPRDSYRATRYPIILCHGFCGFDRLFNIPGEVLQYWCGIPQALEAHGCTTEVAQVPPFASIETRARALDAFISGKAAQWQRTHNTNAPLKVNLLAHSMGGLDCRYLISRMPHANYTIMSLTTVSTPHRGTPAADFVCARTPARVIDKYFPSLRQLTCTYCKIFNAQTPDDARVRYFSIGAAAHLTPSNPYYVPWTIIAREEGPNDGMVSLHSARWGEYIGHLEGVDHKNLINWMGVRRLEEALGVYKGFDAVTFYLEVMDELAKRGF